MAKPQRWTDEWVRALEHPKPGEPEIVYRDPSLSGHRLTVKRTRKLFEVQGKRPKRFGPAKTFVVIVGDALDCTVEEARSRAAVVLSQIRSGNDPRSKPATAVTTLGGAWAEFKARTDIRASTAAMYEDVYDRHLTIWAATPLRTLLDNPRMAKQEHARLRMYKKNPASLPGSDELHDVLSYGHIPIHDIH